MGEPGCSKAFHNNHNRVNSLNDLKPKFKYKIHNKKPLDWPVDDRLLDFLSEVPMYKRKRLCCFDTKVFIFEMELNY